MKQLLFIALVSMLTSCNNNHLPKQNIQSQSFEFTINAIGNNMIDMDYDTKELKVKRGSKVIVNLMNQVKDASMLHNIVFVKQGYEKEVAIEGLNFKEQNYFNASNPNVIAGSAIAQSDSIVVVEFTAPESGTYTYICTYPGHWMKMQGIMTVE